MTTGSYFMTPPLYMVAAARDDERPDRLLVTADDGSHWYADIPSTDGTVSAILTRIE